MASRVIARSNRVYDESPGPAFGICALLVLGAALLSLLLRETYGRNVWSELADGA